MARSPIWKSIADTLSAEIAEGHYPAGAKLPTEAQLAARFGVNRHTVRQSLAALAEAGTVLARRGAGVFVMGRPADYPLSRRVRFHQNVEASGRTPSRQMSLMETRLADAREAEALALPVTMLVNATLSLPYLFRLLLPELRQIQADYRRLMLTLGLPSMAVLRWVLLPRLARPLGFGTGLAAALSMGDLGVIALFAGQQGATLPLLVQRLMGAYRMEAAAAAALVLVAISFALFWAFDRLGSRDVDA